MPSPNQPTYHQLNSPSPNNPNATLHVMQPPQQSPQIPPQMSPQLGSGAPVGSGPGGYMGRSPPQPGGGGGGGGGHHLNNNEPGTTSEDSDDAIPANTLKRPSPEPVYDGDSNNSKTSAGASLAKKPKVAKKKKKRDPNEPQKPVSAYALFFRDTQAAIKGQSPNASFGEVSKIVASMWDVLATEHKNVYKKKTEAAKKEYLKALAAYRASLVSKGTEGDPPQQQQQQSSQQQHQPMYSPPPPPQQQHSGQQQSNHLVNHSQPSPQHGQPVPQVSPHMPMPGQGGQMPPQPNSYPPPYASPYKSPQQTMMQMQPHLQHHSQPPMHPGQAQPQPPPHHMQMNPMATAQQQQQQQQMMVQQQQQQQMGMPPQQQQQNHLTNANMNGMMNMGMTPPQSHYMNQQYSSHLTDVTQSATRTTAPSGSWPSDAAAAATVGWSHEPSPGCSSALRQPTAAERHSPAMYPARMSEPGDRQFRLGG